MSLPGDALRFELRRGLDDDDVIFLAVVYDEAYAR